MATTTEAITKIPAMAISPVNVCRRCLLLGDGVRSISRRYKNYMLETTTNDAELTIEWLIGLFLSGKVTEGNR